MDDIREQIVATLTQQGTLTSLKAQLRAAVFAAIKESGSAPARCERREWLLSMEEGLSVAALVKEFLSWCDLSSTVKVFEAEIGMSEELCERTDLAGQLLLNEEEDQPLLLTMLQGFLLHQPDPYASMQGHFGTLKQGDARDFEADNTDFRHGEDGFSQTQTEASQSGSLIKAMHSHVESPPPRETSDHDSRLDGKHDTREYEQQIGIHSRVQNQRVIPRLDHLGIDDSPNLRSHPTRISDTGDQSPNRKSVEELKKHFQAQGLGIKSPLTSPDRPKSGREASF